MNVRDSLLELQRIDVAIMRLEKQLLEMPEKRAILEARKRIQDIQVLEGRTDKFVGEIEAVVSKLEDEVALLTTKMDSEQAKLLSGKITNPKEVQNISLELDALKRRKDSLETEILSEMERREKALEQKKKITSAIAEAQAKEETLVEGFKGKGGGLQEKIEGLRSERNQIAQALPAEIAALYESKRAAKPGVVVGVLSGVTCGACRMELPVETARDLRDGAEVSECPLCQRILIVSADEGTE